MVLQQQFVQPSKQISPKYLWMKLKDIKLLLSHILPTAKQQQLRLKMSMNHSSLYTVTRVTILRTILL